MFETSLGGSNLINRNTPDDTNNHDDFDFELSPKKDGMYTDRDMYILSIAF